MALLSLLAVLATASSARVTPPPQVMCPGVLRPALELIVKNERGQVLSQFGWPVTDAGWLKVTKTGERYTVTINRRWYQPQTISNIKVVQDDCGPAKPTRVVARLQPVPGAPVIREFRIVNVNSDNLMVVGYWPYFQRYTTFLDAPGTVSREVVWTSSRPDVATIDQSGLLRSVCHREPGRTTITATLKSDPTQVSRTVFGRGGGGMVCPRGEVDR